MDAPIPDPYRACPAACTHELSRGVLISELLEGDGPFPAVSLMVNLASPRPAAFDDDRIAGRQPLLVDAV